MASFPGVSDYGVMPQYKNVVHGKKSIAEKTIQNLSSAKYLSWLYDMGIVAKLNACRTEMRILPSYHYNFVGATKEV